MLTKLVQSIEQHPLNQAKPLEPAKTPVDKIKLKIDLWNQSNPVGTPVRVASLDNPLTTRSQAILLFGHRAAIYLQGYNGYFALDDVTPAS